MVTKTFTCDGTADGVRYPQTVSESRILGMRQYAHTAVSAYWCIRCIQYPCILGFVSIHKYPGIQVTPGSVAELKARCVFNKF